MRERERILVVDDEAAIRKQLRWALSDEYEVRTAADRAEALAEARSFRPHLVTLDVSLTARAGESDEGLKILAELRETAPSTKVIVVTASDRAEHGARAVDLGAYDYYEKPINLDELRVVVRRALHIRRLEQGADALHEEAAVEERFAGLVCSGNAMRDVFAQVNRAAPTDVGVVLVGERGSGREALARVIHRLSGRPGKFGVVDCGAAPGDRLNEELFGFIEGREAEGPVGALSECSDGTLLLAEVDSMPLAVQARLVRHLEGGGSQDVQSIGRPPRFVSSARDCLDRLVASSGFREDLCYALGVVTIDVPPLRDRGSDVVEIASGLLRGYAREHSRPARRFTRTAARAMLSYAWPGNALELENRVMRAVIMSRGRSVTASDLGLEADVEGRPVTLVEARGELERDMVVDALVRSAGNVSRAARSIGVSRPTMYDLIRKHDIDLNGLKGAAGH